jgi:hypothetical protein
MKRYIIKLVDNAMPDPEYWLHGKTWGIDRSDATMFVSEIAARQHCISMGWCKVRQARGAIEIEEVDTDLPEFKVKIVRTETAEHTVRIRAKDEREARQIVYEMDCRDEFASVWEEGDYSVETEYYPTEVLDGKDS